MEETIPCPVSILSASCGQPIKPGEGVLVGNGGRAWIVCKSCHQRGVRIADVEHAQPVIGGEVS